jgi:hypothetical protein
MPSSRDSSVARARERYMYIKTRTLNCVTKGRFGDLEKLFAYHQNSTRYVPSVGKHDAMHENTQYHDHSHLPIHTFTPRLGSGVVTHVRATSCVRWLATERTRLPTRPFYISGPCPSRLQLAEAAFRLPVALQAVPRPSCTSASLSPRDHLAGVQRGGMSGTHQHHPAPKARPPTSQQINEVDAYAVTSHRIWSSCTRMASRCSAP